MKVKSAKGFSLLEMLVVITLLLIVASVAVPYFNSFVANRNLQEAVGALMADLNFAKQSAVTQNINYTVSFSVSDNTYTVQGGTYNVTKNLNDFGSRTFIFSQNFSSDKVTFQPRGTISGAGGTIYLRNNKDSSIHVVVNLLGRVTKTIDQLKN
jgi:type IV fimbrial biogenesis protein FimT